MTGRLSSLSLCDPGMDLQPAQGAPHLSFSDQQKEMDEWMDVRTNK